ncbi:MAG TPA: sulfate ABC transporter ATP-binding protein [Hungateiclostridium thermocellum]|jgi:sulfate transport system ATP-binding protein|uniref:Sulfate ABC transporter, ATPase subunit n=2 Tax=Acetivibrio thermocellus TaxID=1515 RepID=A3DIF7_ACET2|nr:sulfate/molybdate ABC transporter ATP-binding protein [Acetivibrio thermocellus]CDG37009.1 Sulfate/thiosulfate import ATP-binding protein CysA [Acetivibrio thermocellus BC1]ABN53736.1 sulfate ABC transporter, ATPase subunit [Acetivibrio thermocellus ATCC 27405]ADU73214.1 sulfate ABC transporter, ATPase subunit [Acetivibrio thermocellus DSM 1313]ALX07129.1 sulfate ABC transporter, ATPase subunit [Acetivibrio thermocellus AD2]ANV74865.1 sulfate ABC transporter, ATPase subunit [Acetivibrio the
MSIEIRNVSKTFDSFKALSNINLHINTGELVALLGPSGSGKTTLLRIIAGLETADEGSIIFDGEDNTKKSAQDRKVGFVFQHYALFKHMTVFENIAFGLRVMPSKIRPNKEAIKNKVYELLKLVKMEELANRYPSQLSGGQRQRIALARALAVEPKVLLLDEPFGALDAKVRKDLRRWLRKLHDEYPITSVFVTHDQEEALDVADRVVILNQGKIEQIGTPEEVYDNPANPFVYNFLGNVNLFHGRIHNGKVELGLPGADSDGGQGKDIVSYTRPHDIEIKLEPEGKEFIGSRITFIRAVGPIVKIELVRLDNGQYIEAEISKETYRKLGLKERQTVYVRPKDFKVFIPEDYVI